MAIPACVNRLSASEDNDIGDAFTDGTYDRIMRLREQNEKIKVLLAVGGWAFGSEPFRKLTENVFRMNGFVYDAIEFLRKYNFDGLDIDWEYPRGADDRAAFVSLIKELRLAFEGEAKSTDNEKLLLTAAVPARVAHLHYFLLTLNTFREEDAIFDRSKLLALNRG